MNVYEIAQKVNDRINDGDESEFSTTLLVVTEFLYAFKPINYFGWATRGVACGDADEFIMDEISIYNENDTNDSLGPMIELQDSFNNMNQKFIEAKSQVVRVLCVSTLLTGVAIGCYMVSR